MRKGTVALIAVAAVFVAAWIVEASGAACVQVFGHDFVSIDIRQILPNTAKAFCYTDSAGKRLRFILARGDDGKVRSVLDACRQCYPYHRGFKLEKGQLVCRVCGNRYPIEHMTEGKASCVPVSLEHREDGHTAKVRVSDLIDKRAMF